MYKKKLIKLEKNFKIKIIKIESPKNHDKI